MLNQLKRGIQIGKAGLAARQLRNADDERTREIARKALAQVFSNARGVMMKVGQLLVDSEDSPYRKLLDNIEPFPLEIMLPEIEKSLGRPVEEVFASIEESSAAASLGQVHPATLLNGDKVAIKVQYPDIADAVEAELKLAGLLPGMGPVKKWGFDLESYKRELRDNMQQELDYTSEAARQDAFQKGVSVAGLTIPKVYSELCSPRLLVQSWETGVNINKIADWPSEDRQSVARVLIKTLFTSLFSHGEIHGDPHIGNSFYRRGITGPEVVLLDFGCTVSINKQARMALLKLIIALRENTDISPLQCFAAMGFSAEKLNHINRALPMLCQVLFRPFLADGRFRLGDWHLQKDLDSLLGEERWWFRSAGPADLFLLIRAFQGLSQNLEHIQSFSPWYELLLESLGPDLIEQARNYSLPSLPANIAVGASHTSTLATKLIVNVFENNKQTVGVTLPASAVLELGTLMPEDVYRQLNESRDIDLEDILKRIKESGIAPQEVFDYTQGAKRYKVWLE